jgi:hypothetical protein
LDRLLEETIMVVPVGVSFGDFVAIANIVNEIQKCIRCVPQLRDEISTLLKHYGDLKLSIQAVMAVYSGEGVAVDEQVSNRVQQHLRSCTSLIQQFEAQVSTIIRRKKDGSLNTRMKDFGRKAVFASKRRNVFSKLNDDFQREMEGFKMEVLSLSRSASFATLL